MPEELTLLTCPACGGKTALVKRPIYDSGGNSIPTWCVECVKCGLFTGMYPYADIAAKKWNALPRALEWTNEPPKVSGWYWNRDTRHPNEAGFLFVSNSRIEQLQRMSKPTEQWSSGPIPEPREPKEQGGYDG